MAHLRQSRIGLITFMDQTCLSTIMVEALDETDCLYRLAWVFSELQRRGSMADSAHQPLQSLVK